MQLGYRSRLSSRRSSWLCIRTAVIALFITGIESGMLLPTVTVATCGKDLNSVSNETSSSAWKHVFLSSSQPLYRNRRLLLGTERISSEECTKSDISIFQGRSSPLPNGIPTYTVQIINLCVAGCPMTNVHVSCGWFASAKLVNPKLFKRIGFGDCIVNDGKAIGGGDSIFFQYANSFQYPMRVVSAKACSGA